MSQSKCCNLGGRSAWGLTAQDGGSFQAAEPMHYLSQDSVHHCGSIRSLKGLAYYEATMHQVATATRTQAGLSNTGKQGNAGSDVCSAICMQATGIALSSKSEMWVLTYQQ